MTFDEYQLRTANTAVYPEAGDGNFLYPTLGLCGEAGEVAENVKKTLRDDGGFLTADRQARLEKELGDVLWYVSQLATEIGVPLGDIAEANLEKLASRKQRGVLHGSGSGR